MGRREEKLEGEESRGQMKGGKKGVKNGSGKGIRKPRKEGEHGKGEYENMGRD